MNTRVVSAKAPVRISFGGGGTDVDPYCSAYGGAVLNVAIQKYAKCKISILAYPSIEYVIDNAVVRVGSFDDLSIDKFMPLHTGLLVFFFDELHRHFRSTFGLRIETASEAPPGSGLGGSSALMVSMVKAMDALLDLQKDPCWVATTAYEIERNVCALAGGRQDQFASAIGGLNRFNFLPSGEVQCIPVNIKPQHLDYLNQSLIICTTGISRRSENIILEHQKNMSEKRQTIALLDEIKNNCGATHIALEDWNFERFVESIEAGWNLKKDLTATIVNPQIEALISMMLRGGGRANRLLGAGGGGFVLSIVNPKERAKQAAYLKENGYAPETVLFDFKGATAYVGSCGR